MRVLHILFAAVIAAATAIPAFAQDERGQVTNLPIPRYVSLKAEEGNARRGPSLSHRIDWVFTRRNMPLRVTGEYGHWRRVQDRDGQGGWMHYSLISGVRHVIVQSDMVPMRTKPDPESTVNAYAEAGVVARLGECVDAWCWVSRDGSSGWVPKSVLWGVKPGELRD